MSDVVDKLISEPIKELKKMKIKQVEFIFIFIFIRSLHKSIRFYWLLESLL